MTLDNILEEIKKAESIVILAHETPDGDAIGSCLAMNVALKKLGKNPDVIIKEVPRIFDFLPNRNEVKISSEIQKYDLVVVGHTHKNFEIENVVGVSATGIGKPTFVLIEIGEKVTYKYISEE